MIRQTRNSCLNYFLNVIIIRIINYFTYESNVIIKIVFDRFLCSQINFARVKRESTVLIS